MTTSPENFKGGGIWNVIVGINDALKAIAYALLFIRGASPVIDEKYDLMHHPAISHSSLGGAAPYIHHGTKPPIYTGRPLLRVGGAENSNPLKGEFH